jgi:hypothetical protein
MSAADQIPEMTDADLARFHANTVRIHGAGVGPRFEQAAGLLPLLEAELAARAAAKPPTKAAQAKSAKAAKAAAAAQAAEVAEAEALEEAEMKAEEPVEA